MEITPLFELLIYIEDRGAVKVSELDMFSPAVLRGILGKMEAMKLIDRDGDSFKISKKGQQTLNSVLDYLHKSTLHWDGKWRFVSFSVPESNRSVRDKFRRTLDNMGIKMILNGLWVTPLDLKSEIIKAAKELGIFDSLLVIESSQILTGLSQEQFQRLWNFEKSRNQIYDFLRMSDEFLKQKNQDGFEIKKMIFRYALILANQPKIPIEQFPADWPQFRANLAYKKIRRLLGK